MDAAPNTIRRPSTRAERYAARQEAIFASARRPPAPRAAVERPADVALATAAAHEFPQQTEAPRLDGAAPSPAPARAGEPRPSPQREDEQSPVPRAEVGEPPAPPAPPAGAGAPPAPPAGAGEPPAQQQEAAAGSAPPEGGGRDEPVRHPTGSAGPRDPVQAAGELESAERALAEAAHPAAGAPMEVDAWAGAPLRRSLRAKRRVELFTSDERVVAPKWRVPKKRVRPASPVALAPPRPPEPAAPRAVAALAPPAGADDDLWDLYIPQILARARSPMHAARLMFLASPKWSSWLVRGARDADITAGAESWTERYQPPLSAQRLRERVSLYSTLGELGEIISETAPSALVARRLEAWAPGSERCTFVGANNTAIWVADSVNASEFVAPGLAAAASVLTACAVVAAERRSPGVTAELLGEHSPPPAPEQLCELVDSELAFRDGLLGAAIFATAGGVDAATACGASWSKLSSSLFGWIAPVARLAARRAEAGARFRRTLDKWRFPITQFLFAETVLAAEFTMSGREGHTGITSLEVLLPTYEIPQSEFILAEQVFHHSLRSLDMLVRSSLFVKFVESRSCQPIRFNIGGQTAPQRRAGAANPADQGWPVTARAGSLASAAELEREWRSVQRSQKYSLNTRYSPFNARKGAEAARYRTMQLTVPTLGYLCKFDPSEWPDLMRLSVDCGDSLQGLIPVQFRECDDIAFTLELTVRDRPATFPVEWARSLKRLHLKFELKPDDLAGGRLNWRQLNRRCIFPLRRVSPETFNAFETTAPGVPESFELDWSVARFLEHARLQDNENDAGVYATMVDYRHDCVNRWVCYVDDDETAVGEANCESFPALTELRLDFSGCRPPGADGGVTIAFEHLVELVARICGPTSGRATEFWPVVDVVGARIETAGPPAWVEAWRHVRDGEVTNVFAAPPGLPPQLTRDALGLVRAVAEQAERLESAEATLLRLQYETAASEARAMEADAAAGVPPDAPLRDGPRGEWRRHFVAWRVPEHCVAVTTPPHQQALSPATP